MSNSNSTTWDAELVALRDTILEDAAALGRPVTLREAAEMARNQIGALREYAADWDGFSDEVLLANHWPTDTDHAKVAGELSKFAAAWDAYAAQLAAMGPQPEPTPPAAPAARTAGDRARDKAAYHLAQGLKIVQMGAAALVPSGTRGGVIHRVQDGVCSCEAGQNGKLCWHVFAVELASAPELKRAA